MTKPCYPPQGCAARSQVRGIASSSPDPESADYARNVSFNNGNSNINHRNNDYHVLACRGGLGAVGGVSPGECQGAGQATFEDLRKAWKRARRQKQLSANQLRFEVHWPDRLIEMEREINDGTWSPKPSALSIAQRPKARQIHAPDFYDRVGHHWVIPWLEEKYEPIFVHDSYANRKGKGTHAAVTQLQRMVRQVDSGQGPAWVLQMDIHNFFNSIPRWKLWKLLKRFMAKHRVPETIQRMVHALLRRPPLEPGVIHRATPAERAKVPPHKRLENAEPGCGLPIGNLSSQFFANVYLDQLDQFVKHVLKAKRYARYVDDFVLVHRSREQLLEWKARIEEFLQDELHLRLKPGTKLIPAAGGIDFLGFVVRPHHLLVRRRVVHHAREALQRWGQQHRCAGAIRATPAALREIRSVWASYQGHFKHARDWNLRQRFHSEFPWLHAAAQVRRRFHYLAEGRAITIPLGAE